MAIEVHVRKLAESWQYDFKPPGEPRERKGGFRTKQAALCAGQKRLAEVELGARKITFEQAFRDYLAATQMKNRAKDAYEHHWKRIGPLLGYLYIEEITTSELDRFKQRLPRDLGPQTVNHHLTLIRAVLRFMWKREKLSRLPYIPTLSVPKRDAPWYTTEERDLLLDGLFRLRPRWYLFFYLTCRLGLRRGEVYAISRDKIREDPPQLVVDVQVEMGTKTRPAQIGTRKNNEAYTLEVTRDVLDAIRWHIDQGYAGERFLFSDDGTFPRWLDSYKHPLLFVQRELDLRELGHHAIGRHSVASQAATGGESIKAIQAQLGHRCESSTHRYTHLGSRAQLHVVESLTPAVRPHEGKSLEQGNDHRAAG
ncbi:MAG: tyrosine-type recombinase/integrase [Proteobacteria bacterium]|jgi:integrase|nr:tyrosine-type recombinase/integrase [Pseudomonadota bacterium]